ncbi:SDR family NAD(P)-dependent oxidoreductase [Arthrobacter sp. ISL-48]|uniref:SDR family NAD(P)-dependent oxidoreductase n=1 Tax=Arthrobacter sp. ISL-48 TaxID=2819110 RepID=UPI001BE672D5|nr:SDR family NAD(P)-dependent oxidoreductase [Arthrobacter sp. ISL-48]MBT2534535.1 SDR family NAD(P)-dependent oxidoreductase [Arthrobacter sp. ISL-48]
MSRIFITGSSEGLGRNAALDLLDDGHDLVLHARNPRRADALSDLAARGVQVVTGDLARTDDVRAIAEQVNSIGRMDAIIHNAGVVDGAALLPVNVVAPYLLTALIERPDRLVYLSSGMHRGGRADLTGADWSGTRATKTYSDSKLFITAFTMFLARTWPEVHTNAVDPGWVPTRMGGAGASDDLREGHLTQAWLAGSKDPGAEVTGGYWHHMHQQAPHPATLNQDFQDELIAQLADHTGVPLPIPADRLKGES